MTEEHDATASDSALVDAAELREAGVHDAANAPSDEGDGIVKDSSVDRLEFSTEGGAPNDAGDASTPLLVAPGHLKLWLTADRGLACSSGRVSRWMDQSGNGDDAVPPQLGPKCQITGTPHVVNGIDVPYFSAPANGNVVDETLDVDLGFLMQSEYTIFGVERRWADLPSGNHYQFILGTNVQNEATFVAPDCSPSNYNTFLLFGYVYYDQSPVDLSLDQYCNKVNQAVTLVPTPPPAALTVDVAILDKTRGHEIFQGTVPLAASPDVSLLSAATAGAVGRALVRTSASGIDPRFRGDIAEILVYNTALDNAALNAVRGHLTAHWGLQ